MAAAIVAIRHARKSDGRYVAPSSVVSQKRAKTEQEQREFWEHIERENKINAIMKKYDKDGDHKISRSELAVFMQDLAGGEVPTEEECEYVLKVADASDKVINGFVNRNEIEVAVQIWKNHLSNKQDIEETFAKYDLNHDNKLQHEELKALLTDLNDGHPVSDEEVKAVMNEADGSHGAVEKTGGINKTELMGAIALWYGHVEEHQKCCAIM